jgi:hypothetical protein
LERYPREPSEVMTILQSFIEAETTKILRILREMTPDAFGAMLVVNAHFNRLPIDISVGFVLNVRIRGLVLVPNLSRPAKVGSLAALSLLKFFVANAEAVSSTAGKVKACGNTGCRRTEARAWDE